MGRYIFINYYVKKDKCWERIPAEKDKDGHYRFINYPNKLYVVYDLLEDVAEKRDTYPPDASDDLKETLRWDEEDVAMWEDFNAKWCYISKIIEKFEKESDFHDFVKTYIDCIRRDLLGEYPLNDLIAVWFYS